MERADGEAVDDTSGGVVSPMTREDLVSQPSNVRAPSYTGLQSASEASSRAKRSNVRRDTAPELLLRRVLWRHNLRFRKNVESLPGKPDVVFTGARVAVFCDGDFWHGRDWPALKEKLNRGTNPSYWSAKIASNIVRDAQANAALEEAGWRVVRLWETDIKRDPAGEARRVIDVVRVANGESDVREVGAE
jgi:DNA mismatch endonuclease (patch repair protein)